jgi:phosphohistidine phosphatase SixA
MAEKMSELKLDRSWRWIVVACITIVIVIYIWCCWLLPSPTTIYLVRHAEKDTGSNPNLTLAGQQRADALQQLLRSVSLDAVYSTEYCRTAQTGQPTAQAQGLNIRVATTSGPQADFSSCTPIIQVQTQLTDASSSHASAVASDILSHHKGGEILVVGHSNTVPEIAEALGVSSLCPDLALLGANGECIIPESQFDNLFIVDVYGSNRAHWHRLRYGGMTP